MISLVQINESDFGPGGTRTVAAAVEHVGLNLSFPRCVCLETKNSKWIYVIY